MRVFVLSALLQGAALALVRPVRVEGAARDLRAAATALVELDEPAMRLGHGYDIHRMEPREEAGQPVVISGVRFDGSEGHAPDFELGLVAHSDGDVVYHSVVDAILGALGMCVEGAEGKSRPKHLGFSDEHEETGWILPRPDIGQLFPDNDPRLRGADSSIFMEEAYKRMKGRSYRIGNCDITLICQKPRINVGDVKETMRRNVARLLETSFDRVNLKARTHEKVDSVGECRALECHVVIALEKVV